MVMKLYGFTTPNVQRAILPLFLADVDAEKDLELVKVNVMGYQQRSPNYLAKQPFGVIPYLEDGELGIFGFAVGWGNAESRAIAKYLVDKYELTYLVGKTPQEKAVINQWVESESQNFHAAIGPLIREIFMSRFLKRPADEGFIAKNLETLGKVLDVYEGQLAKNKYLAGDGYTLADALHTPFLDKVRTLDVFAGVLDKRPHVKAWVSDITSNPAFVKCTKMDWDNAIPI